MGLDISAYSKIRQSDKGDIEIRHEMIDYTEGNWPGRTEGLTSGTYVTDCKGEHFKAGSYGTYSAWRDALARLAGHGSAAQVWALDSPEGPFVEMIDFSDCEGLIGPKVAAKLHKDFADHLPKAEMEGGWFLDRYGHWMRAFELAADGGFLEFA